MIYLMENEKGARDLIIYTLKIAGFTIKSVNNGQQLWEYVNNEFPELLLLDIMLPDNEGFDILERVRNHKILKNLPVILLAEKESDYDKVIGADDYLLKPFEAKELIARVKSLIRMYSPAWKSADYFIGKLCLNAANHTVEVDGKKIRLSYKEFELLNYFLDNTGYVLTRERIMEEVWGQCFQKELRTVDVHVRYLRQKLGEAGKMIETVWGIGYRISEPLMTKVTSGSEHL